MDLPKSIRMALAIRNMNRTELSKKAGITTAYISLLMNEKQTARMSTIEKIASSFDMPVSEFIALGE